MPRFTPSSDSPPVVAFDLFESPTNVCDSCGTVMEAWFTAVEAGEHTFRIAGSVNAHLWFGPTCEEAMAADPIATAHCWTSVRQWDKYGVQTAAPSTAAAAGEYTFRIAVDDKAHM